MIWFLCKGLVRDRSRSLFPLLVVAIGVALSAVMHAWINGALGNMIESSAHFQTGHVKVMSRAYEAQAEMAPNDLALLEVDSLRAQLAARFPELVWTARIDFGGLLDVPDEEGETRVQGPAMGLGVDLLGVGSPEPEMLQLAQGLLRGHLPREAGEILIGEELARRLGLEPGGMATLISTTMYGSMAMHNFAVAGVVRFGVRGLDQSAVIADIRDVQQALDMEGAAGVVLGFFRSGSFESRRAAEVAREFDDRYRDRADEFAPLMQTLREQNGLGELLDQMQAIMGGVVAVFLLVMFIVLWNAGLMGSLRRYGEFGVRLAIGEDRGHLFRALLWEALAIGVAGSAIGTVVGLGFAYWLQVEGIDVGSMLKNSSMMVAGVFRAQITPVTWVNGFLPGVLATLLGTAAAGVGIRRRQTAQLFKELEM